MRDDVIRTKITAPSLPWSLISRPRLHAHLDAHPGRFIVFSAPAGFGKTAAVLDWIHTRHLRVAWLSVDRYDDDPVRFFGHLAAAFETLGAEETRAVAALIVTLAQRDGPVPELQPALAALPDDVVVVLDDVHEVAAPRVLGGLAQLLESRRAGPRIVMLSRFDLPFPLARLRVSGDLLVLRAHDLRFNSDECITFFGGAGGLDAELVRLLEQRTEGWVAGLRMAEIALRGAADPASVVRSFAGTQRIVVDYLIAEALETQSPQLQEFLLGTSVLERFTAEACAAITGDADAAARLAEVEAASLFLVSLGGDRRWYRYHHLFRELLEFRLQQRQPDRVQLLRARASAWFEQAGHVHEAVEHACRLDDPLRLMQLLDTWGIDIVSRSELATFGRWLRHVPAPLSRPFPMMIVCIGWLRILTERAPDLGPLLDAAEAALQSVGPDYDDFRRRSARLQLDVLRAYAARFAGRLDEAIEISDAVQRELPPDDALVRGLVIFNEARLRMTLGEMLPAARLLEASFEENLRGDMSYLLLAGLGQAATVSVQLEGVHRARERLRAAVAFAEQRYLTSLPAYSSVLYHLGNVEYIADCLDDAEAACTRAIELGRASNFPEGHANGLLLLARIEAARRRFERAGQLLAELAALAHQHNVILLDTTVPLEQVRLALACEQCGAGPPTAALEAQPPGGRWTLAHETELLLALRQALRAGDGGRAAALARRLSADTEPRGRGVALCVARLAEAMLAEAPHRWTALDQALEFAGTRGYVRPILELGEVVRPLLQSALARPVSGPARAFARLLLARLDETAGAVRQDARDPGTVAAVTLVEPLTPREEEVLRYLAGELSSKAMARAMFVSVETVKTHRKHLYWKLGAASRQQALARARELGLVPLPDPPA